jgi:glycosyltransferase involved in cell wall biosynthesis
MINNGRAMRLLLGNKYWYPKGGAESYLFEVMDELRARGVELVPFGMKHPRNRASTFERFFVDEVDYDQPASWFQQLRTAQRIVYSFHAKRKMEALLREVQPDLAHIHNIYHQISPSVLIALSRRAIPVVMTLHDLKLACPNYKMRTHGELCERCVGGHYHNAVLRRCVGDSLLRSALCATESWVHRSFGLYQRNVERFIVPSRFYLEKMIQSGIPSSKLSVLPNFTHVDRFRPSYEPSDYAIYFGRLSAEKGLLSLLRAMSSLRRGRLLIAGEGPLRTQLEQTIAANELDNVELVGQKSGRELEEIVRAARFSVIPSEWYENCPLSGIESFASGTPVLAAAIGGLTEMVDDEENGLLFEAFEVEDLADKMGRLFDDDDLATRLGRGARSKAEREYGVRSHVDRLFQIYERARSRETEEARVG